MTTADASRACFVVRGSEPFTSAQGARYAPGVSAETVGAESLFLGLITLPAGERTKAHLQHRSVARPDDYLYIPAGMPHVAVSRGSEPAVFVGARGEASSQESVTMLPELEGLVP